MMMSKNSDSKLLENFVKALAEEGLADANVSHAYDQNRQGHLFSVELCSVSESPKRTTLISERSISISSDKQQVIAMEAQEIARDIKESLTDLQEWGEKAVRLDVERKNEATCLRCGATATIEDLKKGPVMNSTMSETTLPNHSIQGVRSLSNIKKKLALIAMLRNKCKPHCPNSNEELHRNI
jgi:hypothetical protein